MLLDRQLFERTRQHVVAATCNAIAETFPFPHVVIKDIFPADVYQQLVDRFPSTVHFDKANPRHHSDEYGNSTRLRMNLMDQSLKVLSPEDQMLWATVRAAISCKETRDAVFSKVASGLCRRFGVDEDKLPDIPAFPRGLIYSEVEGFRIAPHPDTREKIVTMQFAFPSDNSLESVGTEFYQRSVNPLHYLREPRGFVVARTMPFLPNHAYAFSVLNDFGLKSWHGRSTIPPMDKVRNSLLHIWYTEADNSNRDLDSYWQFLKQPPSESRKAA